MEANAAANAVDAKVAAVEQTPAAPAIVAKRQVKTLKATKNQLRSIQATEGRFETDGGNKNG